jgi:hypothetical protein
MLNIMFAELIEGNYVLYQGDLSTNRIVVGKSIGAVITGRKQLSHASGPAPEIFILKIRTLKKGRMRPVMARKPAYDIQESSPA